MLQSSNQSYDSVVKENNDLKKYVKNIKQRYQKYQKQQQHKYFDKEREYFKQKQPKNIKKLCTRKRVTVNLKQRRVSMRLERRRYCRKKKQ